MDEYCIEKLRAKRILKYRIQRIFFGIILIIAILAAGYLGWASRLLVASSLGIVKHQISPLRPRS